ncbi:nucleotide excision repair, TFIIH, subunit [Calocera viscosa TUFC12733]|uniref:General transcription and DNA repair factor IIH subunit TFB5 n=1 Tax=Calocera viscosa (strain TUFC12733) TaxID=1330018 RepID=A0A167GJM2_CALVF|nr:nucleotide excision repair, TFIIH, subunit [Calocera viscosa TUFC12733]
MKAYKGALLTCDAAVKQILLMMDESEKFIIQDLDDTHLIVQMDQLERVQRMLEVELEKNTYSLDPQ